ncbi:hypothetical protein STEG23_015246, partial [Scotinomys teguina]
SPSPNIATVEVKVLPFEVLGNVYSVPRTVYLLPSISCFPSKGKNPYSYDICRTPFSTVYNEVASKKMYYAHFTPQPPYVPVTFSYSKLIDFYTTDQGRKVELKILENKQTNTDRKYWQP